MIDGVHLLGKMGIDEVNSIDSTSLSTLAVVAFMPASTHHPLIAAEEQSQSDAPELPTAVVLSWRERFGASCEILNVVDKTHNDWTALKCARVNKTAQGV